MQNLTSRIIVLILFSDTPNAPSESRICFEAILAYSKRGWLGDVKWRKSDWAFLGNVARLRAARPSALLPSWF